MSFNPSKVFEGLRAVPRALSDYGTLYPKYLNYGLGLAVVAPAALKSDDRGYLKTSLLTTPTIVASAMVAPTLWPVLRQQASLFKGFAKHQRENISAASSAVTDNRVVAGIAKKYREGSASAQELEAKLLEYYQAGLEEGARLTPEQSEIKSLLTQFRRNWAQKEKRELMQAALQAEFNRTLGPSDTRLVQSEMGGNIRDIFHARLASGQAVKFPELLKNASFVRGMNHRLREISNLHNPGLLEKSKNYWDEGILPGRWAEGEPGLEALRKLYPEVAGPKGILSNIPSNRLEVISRFRGTTLDQVLAIRVHFHNRHGRGTHFRDIPVADPLTGKVFTGTEFHIPGIARGAYTHDQKIPFTRFMAEGVAKGVPADVLQDAINRRVVYDNLTEEGAYLRARQYSPAEWGFLGQKGWVPAGKEYPWEGLNAEEQETGLLEAMRKNKFVKVSSSPLHEGIVEDEEVKNLYMMGQYNPARPGSEWRSRTKSRYLVTNPRTGALENLPAFSGTSYLDDKISGRLEHSAGVYAASISHPQKALFGDLPEKFEDLAKPEVFERSVNQVARDLEAAGIAAPRLTAANMWTTMLRHIENQGDLDALRNMARYAGETSYLGKQGELGLSLVDEKHYYVDREARGLERFETESFGKNELLGMLGLDPVHASGEQNLITGRRATPKGTEINVREIYPMQPGIKVEGHAGIKGIYLQQDAEGFDRARELYNQYTTIAGLPDHWSKEAQLLTLRSYGPEKADVVAQTFNQAGDMLRRLKQQGYDELADQYLARLGNDFSFAGGSLRWKAAGTENFEAANQVIHDMFTDVGARIRKREIQASGPWQDWASKGAGDLFEYTWNYHAPINLKGWDASFLDLPNETRVTFDLLGELEARGHYGAVNALRKSLVSDGSRTLTEEFAQYLQTGDFTKKLGESISISAAFPQGIENLGDAAARAGSIFDPNHVLAARNFSIEMPDGSYLPVLGHEAFGGKVNRFGANQYSTSTLEGSLLDAVRAAGNEGRFSAAREDYFGEAKQKIFGKEGYLRQLGTHPDSVAGVIFHRSSPENPFIAGIDPDLLATTRKGWAAKAIERGEEVFGLVQRHPISHPTFYQFVPEPALKGTGAIAIDEGSRILSLADLDRDPGSAILFRPNSEHAHAAIAEARAQVAQGSLQHQELGWARMLRGAEDDPRLARNLGTSTQAEKLKKFLDYKKYPLTAAQGRTAGGATGWISNILTDINLGIEHNNILRDPSKKAFLETMFWDLTRQVPIAAQKKVEKGWDLMKVSSIASQLQSSLRPGGSYEDFINPMLEIARTFGKETDQRAKLPFDVQLPAGKINVHEAILRGIDKDLRDLHAGRPDNIEDVYQMLTASQKKVRTMDPGILGRIEDSVAYVRPKTAQAASKEARVLGGMNAAWRRAAHEVKHAVRGSGAGTILGIGAGIAAVAGLLSTSMKPMAGVSQGFGDGSSSRYRPEQRLGIDGLIPGMAETGSMSSNPPRQALPPAPETRTAVVAPQHRSVDLEIRMRARNRQQAAEASRMFARFAGEGSNRTNITYRGDPPSGSLRLREKIRQEMDNRS